VSSNTRKIFNCEVLSDIHVHLKIDTSINTNLNDQTISINFAIEAFSNLKDGIKRASQIVQDNLLLVGISTVGVKTVTGLIGFGLGLTGAIIGSALGFGIISLFGGTTVTLGMVIGIVAGLLVFFIFVMIATVINTYTSTAYHTCLYLWARDAEKAESVDRVSAPAPLAAVLDF